MQTLSLNNHFKFGYNSQAFNFRALPSDTWNVSYGRCSRAPLDFREECLETARVIARSTSEPIWVLFSGGADSEVALTSFVQAGVPVRAAIARFKDDLNVHDISYAVIACERMQIPYQFFELDVLKFWESQEAWQYAESTRCVSPQLLTTMWLSDQVKGYPVLGSGECYLVKRVPESYVPGVSPYPRSGWDLWEKERIAAWFRHFMVTHRDACPGFFQYTPEIMLSFLLDSDVQRLINDEVIGKLSTVSSKLAIYQKYFDLLPRPKYTGFEKIQPQDAVLRARLMQAFGDSDAVFKTPYEELVAELRPFSHPMPEQKSKEPAPIC